MATVVARSAPIFFQHGPKSPGSTVPAHQRDGPGTQSQKGMEAGDLGQGHPQDILESDQDSTDNSQDQDVPAPLFQQYIAGAEPYAGKEHIHEKALLDRIQLDGSNSGFKQSQVEQGEEHASDDRVRDTVRLEEPDVLFQQLPQIVQ